MTLELRSNTRRSHTGVAGALVSAIVTRLASAQLARAERRQQSRGSPPLSTHLRRDVGLMPEVLEPRSHWDFP
jgi:hypothetical protein